MSDEKCFLDDPQWHQCCCNCKYHLPTHEHCTTNMALRDQIEKVVEKSHCICHIRNGWACCMPECGRIYTNWPEHSIGCEMYTAKEKKESGSPDEDEKDESGDGF